MLLRDQDRPGRRGEPADQSKQFARDRRRKAGRRLVEQIKLGSETNVTASASAWRWPPLSNPAFLSCNVSSLGDQSHT